jgi:uncharacterized membrane protein YbhN (UPF0104 family)
MIEFIKDIIDNIPNLSRVQIGLFLAVIILIYFVEHLIFYNATAFGPMPMPFANGAAAAATAINIPAATPQRRQRHHRKPHH